MSHLGQCLEGGRRFGGETAVSGIALLYLRERQKAGSGRCRQYTRNFPGARIFMFDAARGAL